MINDMGSTTISATVKILTNTLLCPLKVGLSFRAAWEHFPIFRRSVFTISLKLIEKEDLL